MAKSSSRKARVFVVGSSNTDWVVEVPALPRPGETVLGGALRVFAGGKGANQAVAAARAGARVHFVGAFGDDDNGRARRRDLERDGIDCSGSVTRRKMASGVALIAVAAAARGRRGENAIVVAAGANEALRPSDVRRGLASLGQRDVVLCSLEVPLAAVLEASKRCSAAGARLVVNPAPVPRRGLPRELLLRSDFVSPNEHELAQLVRAPGDSAEALARLTRLCRKGGPCVVVTRGPRGVDVCADGRYRRGVVAPPKVRALDTVGAGDCFSGAFAAALSLGETELEAALRFAVAASAISVTRAGAQSSMPKRAEILAFIPRVLSASR